MGHGANLVAGSAWPGAFKVPAVPLGVVAEEWAESRVILKNVYFFQYTTFDNVYIFQHELSLGDSVARNRGCRERAGNDSVPYEVAPMFVAA